MTGVVLGLALAVLASVALNGSYLLQHAGSRGAPVIDVRRPLTTMIGLLRSRWWLAGAAAGAAGWALHVGALSQAPLSLVQAFAAGGLALTVPVAARVFGHRLARAELVAVGLLVAALALLGLGAGSVVGAGGVPALALGVAVGLAVAAALTLAAWRGGPRRAHLLGAAGGVLYGAADAATKAATMAHGVGSAVTSPWTAMVVVASVGAFACFQRGLQTGPPVPVIALMTATTNGVAIVIGLLVFREPLGASPGYALLHAAALLVAVIAGLRLAATQGALEQTGPCDRTDREVVLGGRAGPGGGQEQREGRVGTRSLEDEAAAVG
jgi:hypothetical protein